MFSFSALIYKKVILKKKKRVFRISEVQCKLEIRIFQGLPLKVVVVKKKSESDF